MTVKLNQVQLMDRFVEGFSRIFDFFFNFLFAAAVNYKKTLADSSAVRFRTLPLRLWNSILSAVADCASACIYLCSCVNLYVRSLE